MKKSGLMLLGILALALSFSACQAVQDLVGGGTVPNAPSNVNVTAGSGQVTVSWSSVADAQSYTVYYQTGSFVSTGSPSRQTVNSAPCTVTDLTNGTQYAFIVTASNDKGESSPSIIKTATPTDGGGAAAHPAPVISISSSTTSSITITWDVASDPSLGDAVSYKIYRSATQNGTYTTVGTASVIPYTNQNLQAGQSFWYKVQALYNDAQWSGYSNAIQGTATAASYAIPTGLAVNTSMSTNYSISLTWSMTTNVLKYELQRDTNQTFTTPVLVYQGSSVFFTDTDANLSSTYTYYYRIRAVYSAGSSQYSTPVSGSLSGTVNAAPVVPTGVYVGSPSQSSLTVYWTASPGATGYLVYSPSWNDPVTVSTTSYTVYGLNAGTPYYYYVKAYNSFGNSTQSLTVSGTTLPVGVTAVTPGVPSINSVYSMEDTYNQLTVTWNTPSGANPGSTKYQLYRDTYSNGTFTYLVTETYGTSFTDMNLQSGYTYYYKVRAGNSYEYNGVTNWLWSALSASNGATTPEVQVNLPPYTPLGPEPYSGETQVEPQGLTLYWESPGDPESDELTFDLFIGIQGQSYQQKLWYSSQTSWTPETGFVQSGANYQWYVMARDSANNVTVSPTWYFTTKAAETPPPNVSLLITNPQVAYGIGQVIYLTGVVTSNSMPATPVDYYWYLYTPNGSSSTLTVTPDKKGASFTPDVAGYYEVDLYGVDGSASTFKWLGIQAVSATQGTGTINLQ